MISITYLLPLLCLAITLGWIDKFDLENIPDWIRNLSLLPILALLVSLIINWVHNGFLSTLCYFGITFVFYTLHLFVVGTLLPKIKNHDLFFCIALILSFAVCFWLFYVQF